MIEMSNEIAEKSEGHYYTNPYQVYQATCLMCSPNAQDILISAPGSGKTYVMLLAVSFVLANAEQFDRCVIYSSEEIVVQQILQKVKLFPCEDDVVVTSEWEPWEWRNTYQKALYVIDEAETLIADKLVDLNEDGYNGLVALHDKVIWMFTATLTDYYRDSLKAAFGFDDKIFHRFVTPQKLVGDKDPVQRIEVVLQRSNEESKTAFYSTVTTKAAEGPVIVFIAKDDE